MRKLISLIAALALLAASAAYLVPHAEHALALRLAADEPERLSELRLAKAFKAEVAHREIEAALAADDLDLAESFAALAEARDVSLSADLLARLAASRSARERIRRAASRFGKGFASGEPDGVEGLAGAAAGDLLFYGDLRDLAREGTRFLRGETVDPWMMGLAAAGLVVTAGTYAASGAAAPARAGLSLFKSARRTGKLSADLAADMGRLVRMGDSARVADALADLGRIESKAGARAAIEGLRHADNAADIAKVGQLAEKNGRGTLAVLKTLGRGAIVLGAGAVSGALWVMGAAANIALLLITLSALFAMFARFAWRSGRLLWRGGRYAVVRSAAAT